MPGLEPHPSLASFTRDVAGIEENRTAVMDARNNARANGMEGCRFICGKVEEVLKSTSLKKPTDVLDPEIRLQRGCGSHRGPAAEEDRLCFCDPATFSRDLRLFAKRGYTFSELPY